MRKALALVVLSATIALALVAVLAGPPPSVSPRLVALIVVDQFLYYRLTALDGLFRDGLRTLLDEGASFTSVKFRHGITLTAPGHASISTGLHSSHTGITANNVYHPGLKKRVVSIFDPKEKAVGGPGSTTSPRRLLADTIGDHLKRKHPNARAVSLAMKDRSAILLAGRDADAAYWFSTDCGCWVTSSYYARELPAWLHRFNRTRPADRFASQPWQRLLPDADVYRQHAREDGFPGENFGEANTFPHNWTGHPPDKTFYTQLMDSGFCDEVVLDGVLAAIDGHELGADSTPDLLTVSFAGLDRVGHPYGPLSQEALDAALRLDRVLGRLFRAIDGKVGLAQTVIGLTADHGALPLVEYLQAQGTAAKRSSPSRPSQTPSRTRSESDSRKSATSSPTSIRPTSSSTWKSSKSAASRGPRRKRWAVKRCSPPASSKRSTPTPTCATAPKPTTLFGNSIATRSTNYAASTSSCASRRTITSTARKAAPATARRTTMIATSRCSCWGRASRPDDTIGRRDPKTSRQRWERSSASRCPPNLTAAYCKKPCNSVPPYA